MCARVSITSNYRHIHTHTLIYALGTTLLHNTKHTIYVASQTSTESNIFWGAWLPFWASYFAKCSHSQRTLRTDSETLPAWERSERPIEWKPMVPRTLLGHSRDQKYSCNRVLPAWTQAVNNCPQPRTSANKAIILAWFIGGKLPIWPCGISEVSDIIAVPCAQSPSME